MARLEKCIAFLEGFQPAQIDGIEEKTVVLKRPSGGIRLQGLRHLLEYLQPNVYVHCTTACVVPPGAGTDCLYEGK